MVSPRKTCTRPRVLEALRATSDPMARALDNAPLDDEPNDAAADGGLTEAYDDVASGQLFTLDEVRRELGLSRAPFEED